MKLLHLKAKNIFSIGEAYLPLQNRGLLLINGWSFDENNENGAGKSSLTSKSISWILYGKTVNKFRADSVVNKYSNPKEVSFGEIGFTGVDGVDYKIRRQRNPNKLILTTIDSKTDLTQKLEKDTQSILMKLLGRDFETFLQADFFGQGRTESFFSLSPTSQLEILEQILPLNKLAKWAQAAKEEKNIVSSSLKDINIEIEVLKGKREILESEIKNTKSRAIHYKAEKAKEIQSLGKELKENLDLYKEKENTLNSSNSQLEELSSVWDIEAFNLLVDEDITLLSEISKIQKDIEYKQMQLKGLEDNVCSSCGQKFPNEDEREASRETVEKELQNFNSSLAASLVRSKKIQNTILDLQQHKEAMNKLNFFIQNQNIDLIKDRCDSLQLQIEKLRNETNPYSETLISLEQTLNGLSANSEVLVSWQKKHETELKYLIFWEKAYAQDIKTILIDQACPYIERRANSYLQELDNPQIKIKVSTEKALKKGDSKLQVNIEAQSDTGGSVFGLLSGGEQQIASFALGLALGDVAAFQAKGSSDVVILDEPFTNLSSKNAESIISFLRTKYKKSTILLVSNEDNLKNIVPNSILVEKRNGISLLRK